MNYNIFEIVVSCRKRIHIHLWQSILM